MSKTVLSLVQMSCHGTHAENMQKALDGIAEAAAEGANVVALPELFLSPYFCQKPDDAAAFKTAEKVPGPTHAALAKAAKQHKVVLLGGSIFEKDGKDFYNTATVFLPDGSVAGHYRKNHIPEDYLYHEQHYFASGGQGVSVFDTPYGRIAPMICYDQWFPEFARMATLKGAEILIYPTAIGKIDEQVEENITGDWQAMWTNAQLGHAASNNVYVAAVNRTGREGAITFWGGSFIADPASKIVAQGKDRPTLVTAELDLTRVAALQQAWRFLQCREPLLYKPLTEPLL